MRLLKFLCIEFGLGTMVFLKFRRTDVKERNICLPWRICKCFIEFNRFLIELSYRAKGHNHIMIAIRGF
jgi:hypothetical protein